MARGPERAAAAARQVDGALRVVLAGRETPLIVAAVDLLASFYRAISTYPSLAPQGIAISADNTSD